MRFKITTKELKKRSYNVKISSFFAVLLLIFIVYNNHQYPEKYNDVLFWSILCFVILANLINYYRHRRYLQMVKNHWLEIHPGQLHFYTQGNKTELETDDIAALNFYPKKGTLRHIQIKLKNNRGIRLEGYEEINTLGQLIAEQVPAVHTNKN